jgi:hypothetical protein
MGPSDTYLANRIGQTANVRSHSKCRREYLRKISQNCRAEVRCASRGDSRRELTELPSLASRLALQPIRLRIPHCSTVWQGP